MLQELVEIRSSTVGIIRTITSGRSGVVRIANKVEVTMIRRVAEFSPNRAIKVYNIFRLP